MDQGQGPGRRERVLAFLRMVVVLLGINLGLALLVWFAISLFQREFVSLSGVLFWAALPYFVLAALLILIDAGASITVPVQVLRDREDKGWVLNRARRRSEKGMSYTFSFFSAGVVMLLLSILAGILFEG
jgi:hypothetical protein